MWVSGGCRDLKLSILELQTSLAPFVPRPSAVALQHAVETYQASQSLPALLRAVNKLQPALLPAAWAQTKSKAAAADAKLLTQNIIGSIQIKLLPDIVAAMIPGWCQCLDECCGWLSNPSTL